MTVNELTAYEVLEHRRIDDLGTDSYILKHKKTGARVVLLPNDDENKVFYIGFRTPPTDSTGVAHIIEHTVLCGSRDFPVKDPFIELAKGSLNTFLNAMTYPDKTVYPVASCNDADFQNLMHVYLDAVFYPNIYKTDKIFKQEGWHYEMESADDDLKINGVVYNEMKGAYSSPDDILDKGIMNSLYPDNTYNIESGGDPDVIPSLTYEQYLDFHRRYYHPSNSYIYLYGNMDMVSKLTYIDENYLSHFDHLDIDSSIKMQKPFEKQSVVHKDYSILKTDDLKDNTYLTMNWSVGTSLDRKLYVAFDVLDYCLVSAPGAVLKKALIDKGIGKDVYSEYENGVLQPFFSVIAKNANADQADLFKQTIIECLEKTVKEGLDKKALEAAINVDEFKYREADFGRFPKGLLYGLQVLDSWLYDDMKPFIHIEAGDTYKALRDEIEGDYFEKLIQEYLLDNTHSSMFIMDPVKGLNEEKEAAKSAELQKYKESLTKEDIDRIVRETAELKEYQEAPDLEENLKKIPMLTRMDLRRNVEPFIYEEKKVGDNILLFHDIFTNGIDYLNFVFRMEDVPYELFKYSGILKSVLGLVDTKNYSYGDLYNEINMKTGGFTASIGTYSDRRDLSKFATTFEIAVKVLPSNIDHAFDLATEIIRTSKIDDMKRMKEILDEKMSHMEADLQTAGHRAAALHAAAGFSKAGNVSENLSGITGYRLVQKYAKHYDEAAHKELVEKLSELMKTLFRKENLLVSFTTDKKNYGQIEAKVAEFADNLYTQDCQKGQLEFVPVKSNDAFKTPGQVQYTALAGNFRKNGLEYTGALRVLQVMMGYDFLWNNIRVKGGAYGVMGGASPNGDSYFVTYRDPHLKRSLDVFRQVSDFVRNYEADERTLTGFVIGAIGELDTPKTPSAKGSYGLMAYMCHVDIDKLQEHRDQILDVTVEDIRKLADYVDAFEEDNSICVVGTSEKINQHRDLFDKVEEL